jgi:polyhydroxyalkanoate synthase
MQNFFLNFHETFQRNNNFTQALYQYQQGLMTIMMKLSQNKLFQTVQNQTLINFFFENQELAKKPFSYPLQEFFSQLPSLNYDIKDPQAFFKSFWKISYDTSNKALDSCLDPKLTTSNFMWREIYKGLDPTFSPLFLEEDLSSGENLLKASKLFLEDAINSPDGTFLIKTVDKNAFRVGVDIAATPGKVIFKNELLELLCYDQDKKESKPLLVTMAWINKYYILDLEKQYSFVKWLTEQGYQVFMVSWVNPTASQKNLSLDDYLVKGLLEALKEVKKVTGQEEINCIGYCMGGTLLAILAAYLAAEKEKGIKSLTLLTALTDFTKVGPVEIFIKEEIISAIEKDMEEKGYLSGEDLFSTFSAIKSSDMIWYYFINRYVLGKDSKAMEVLYWNSDSTRIPYRLHSDCLRKLYQQNLLSSGKLLLGKRQINLKSITIPVYFFGTEDDHIAPWDSVFKGLNLIGSKNKTFLLSQSGHVAATINHPAKNKYGYWYNDTGNSNDHEVWLKEAKYMSGSWWDHWKNWMASQGLNKTITTAEPEALGLAPGNYVLIK